MRFLAPFALVLALAAGGCRSRVPGHFGAASVKALALPMRVVADGAEGRACGSDTQRNLPAAVENAIASAEGANALVNVAVFKEPRCIRVRGTAVRVAPRPAE